MKFLRSLAALMLAFLLVPLASAVTVTPTNDVVFYALDNVSANNTDLIKVYHIKHEEMLVQITGTWTATISFQASIDDVNYVSTLAYPIGTVNAAAVTSTTANGVWAIPFNAPYVRVRTTAYTSGTATGSSVVKIVPSPLPLGQLTLGSNQSVNVAQINGVTPLMGNGTTGTGSHRVTIASDNTAFTVNLGTGGTGATALGKAEDAVAASGDTGVPLWTVRRDAATASASAAGDYSETTSNRFGAVYTAGFRTHVRTYSATHNITAAASATDIAWLPGNGTSTVQVTKIRISGIQTTTGTPEVLLILRSTANSGGTSTSFSVGRHEQADAANSSTPIGYTANPTPGTSAGTIRRRYLPVGSATSALSGEVVFELGENGKPIVLSGTTQGLAINLNGVTVTGGVFNMAIEWVEF